MNEYIPYLIVGGLIVLMWGAIFVSALAAAALDSDERPTRQREQIEYLSNREAS